MLYVDHRTYTFKPLKMGKWLALYEECALPVQLKYLGNLIGFFQTEIGTLNQVVHLWGFSDLNDRADVHGFSLAFVALDLSLDDVSDLRRVACHAFLLS